MEEDFCVKCNEFRVIGGQTGLCSSCWWRVAAWPDCRLELGIDEKSKMLQEKESYGIRDIR